MRNTHVNKIPLESLGLLASIFSVFSVEPQFGLQFIEIHYCVFTSDHCNGDYYISFN